MSRFANPRRWVEKRMTALGCCPACRYGLHFQHVENYDPAPEGMLGGFRCPCTGDCAERPVFSALAVQAAIEAIIVHERARTARLLAQHGKMVQGNAAKIQAAARSDERVVGRFLTTAELHAAGQGAGDV